MPNPKYKAPRSKTRKRRSHLSLDMIQTAACPRCHEAKLPHRVCGNCGHYKGREVLKVKEAAK